MTYSWATRRKTSPIIHFPYESEKGCWVVRNTEIGPRDEMELLHNPLDSLSSSGDVECPHHVIGKLLDVCHGNEDVLQRHAAVVGPVLGAFYTPFLFEAC